MLDLSKRRKFLNDWTWTSKARCQALPVTNTFSQSSMSIPDSPLLSLVLIYNPHSVFDATVFDFWNVLVHPFWSMIIFSIPWTKILACTHTELPRVELQVSTPGAMGNARNSTVLYGKLYNARWSPGSSLWLTGRIPSLYLFLVVYINELHSPRKDVSSCSAICQWNFHSVVVVTRPYWNPTFEIRTSPWLTKLNCWKSTPAKPTFVWRMDEKQPSRFGIFHLEVFVMPLHQVFPSPHPVVTIDLTTAVRQMKKKRKILFLQTIRLETTKVSLL